MRIEQVPFSQIDYGTNGTKPVFQVSHKSEGRDPDTMIHHIFSWVYLFFGAGLSMNLVPLVFLELTACSQGLCINFWQLSFSLQSG